MGALVRGIGKLISGLFYILMLGVVIVSAIGTMRGLAGAENGIQQIATVAVGMFGIITPYAILRMLEIADRMRNS
ncbi:hypothetical protein JHL17_34135 [Azospirillum sp. YIM B02556]|uniref:Uncharacterized protein n=1 Tax=Azospirillum endophyticum TaxID=2800326 RepID=A0ABS1FGX1_9PROT|nr:hypothetical protein [Azospirillum endophyticum]MBK1842447.1 hypothetical protein [Azospirillum endophyticum]